VSVGHFDRLRRFPAAISHTRDMLGVLDRCPEQHKDCAHNDEDYHDGAAVIFVSLSEFHGYWNNVMRER
jgi:hypothetical protein